MSRYIATSAAVLLVFTASAGAATFSFDQDPFAGTTALTTPGRQVVGNEISISFNPATDVFSFFYDTFDIPLQVLFANNVAPSLPTTNVNVVVLRTFDNDANPATPFGAGNAADLIANQVTSSAPGFFIYFNSGLDLPRLVFSTDLGASDADLKILARMTNLTGQAGRDAMATFTTANFSVATPEPSSGLLMSAAGAVWACACAWRRRRARS